MVVVVVVASQPFIPPADVSSGVRFIMKRGVLCHRNLMTGSQGPDSDLMQVVLHVT